MIPAPNDRYKKFFDKFQEIDTLPIADYKYQHILGYFCRKYQQAYGTEYQWKYNHQLPTKSYEVWNYNVLCSKLSSDPQILRDYIDWVFLNIVPKAKRKLTAISFMTKDEVVNPYKMNVLLGGKKNLNVDRSTNLPENYHQALGQSLSTITTYGALAFAVQMDPRPIGLDEALEKMKELGFDEEILKRIV